MPNASTFGGLTSFDAQAGYFQTAGQVAIWNQTQQDLNAYNADLERTLAPFIEQTVTDHQFRYYSVGGGRMQEVDSTNNQSRTAEVAPGPSWNVAFPMRGYEDAVATSERIVAQMSKPMFDRALTAIKARHTNTYRAAVLRALFNNTSWTFKDPVFGDLKVQPLANGDADTLYNPVIGSEALATQNNYLGTPADWTTINGTKNPIPLAVNRLSKQFGTPTGGNPIVVFINSAQTVGVQSLPDFKEVDERYVIYGDNQSRVVDYPTDLPGNLLGKSDGALIVQWDFIPAGYAFGMHLGQPAPLIRRVDPPAMGYKPGLQLANPAGDARYPVHTWYYRSWYGVGAGNRLNGVPIDLTNAGGANTYTIPADFV